MLLMKIGVGFLGTALVGAAALSSEGFIHVKVHERSAEGTHLTLCVPAAVVPLALRFAPREQLADASAQIRQYLPVIDAAIPALEHTPDAVLVEVRDNQDHVLIQKRGDSIVVDVDDPGETVHVSVPLVVARNSLRQIAEAGGPM